VATLAMRSAAVRVAVDPLSALIEGKSSAVVFVSCGQVSSAAWLGCPSQDSIDSGLRPH
jgi:hypothetical protein